MRDEPKTILNYSSPAEEEDRERAAEFERREAIERYNESTFGERRPIAAAFLRLAIFLAITSVLTCVLPRRAGQPVVTMLAIAYAINERRKNGWPFNRR